MTVIMTLFGAKTTNISSSFIDYCWEGWREDINQIIATGHNPNFLSSTEMLFVSDGLAADEKTSWVSSLRYETNPEGPTQKES